MSLIKSNVYVCNIKNGTVIRRSHWPSEPWPRSTGKRCRVKGGISVVVPINHRSSLLPWWTLICYCSRAAVRHAADSRWQPGRSGGWGSWRAEGREDRSMWHMWVALGGEDGEVTCLCVCVCVCEKDNSQPSLPASKYYACKRKRRTRERLDALQNHCADCSCF